METTDLNKFFKDASSATEPVSWLAELEAEAQADPASQARVRKALALFARYGPRAEEEAFYHADRRLRDYEGTDLYTQHRSTVEGVYIAAAYSKLALSISLLLQASEA